MNCSASAVQPKLDIQRKSPQPSEPEIRKSVKQGNFASRLVEIKELTTIAFQKRLTA
jgi:hypothetical protein